MCYYKTKQKKKGLKLYSQILSGNYIAIVI